MFTGLIQAVGQIYQLERAPSFTTKLALALPWSDLTLGESIAVDGACLTVESLSQVGGVEIASFDVSEETLARTVVGLYRAGGWVNLERSLRVGDRMGGHYVMGHIDGKAVLHSIERLNDFTRWVIACDRSDLFSYLVEKGAVALNGASLTINERWRAGDTMLFSIMLVPHTLLHTTFGQFQVGQALNIEVDVLVKAMLQRHNYSDERPRTEEYGAF